jgi:predicted RNA-binding Zn ribbon-like protein
VQRLPAIFIADAVALDFLNSVATPAEVRAEWLADGEGLLQWLQQSQLVPAAVLEQIRSQTTPDELNRVAQQARDLREWFRGFVQKYRGQPLVRDSFKKLEPLNRLLERDAAFSQITPTRGHASAAFELRTMRRWQSAESLLVPIAEALARFICCENFAYVKACEGAACTLLFADHTRSRARRWCSMAICGNRAKQAGYRQRLKAERG